MSAYGYARKSSVHDAERDTSYETQEREVSALAARHNDTIDPDRMLTDWDVSGRAKYLGKRKAYARLIEAIQSGECSAIYSYSLSRLGRSTAQLATLFDLCAERKVPIRLVVDSIDTSTASGRLLANVLSSVAQFEAEVAAERIRGSYETRRARARAEGRSETDAVRSRHRYGEREGEDAAAVLAAFRETGSYSRAARVLNERGIKPRDAHAGKAWWSSSVREVVRRLDPSIADKPAHGGRAAGAEGFILSRLLVCPSCAEHGVTRYLAGSTLRQADGSPRVRYACRYAEAWAHPRVAINESLILPAVMAEAALLDTGYDQGSTFAADTRERAAIDAERKRVRDMTQEGIIDLADAKERMRALSDRESRLDARRSLIDLPGAIVWDASPRAVNAQLRALWERIDLDAETFQPTEFAWVMPELRRPALRVVG